MALQKVANLRFPFNKPHLTDELSDGIMWIPYPRSNQVKYVEKPALLRSVLAGLVDLTEIALDIQDLLYDKAFCLDTRSIWIETTELYHRLRRWMEDLPEDLKLDEQPVPQVLYLQYVLALGDCREGKTNQRRSRFD